MKDFALILALNIVASILAGCAGALAMHGIDGWGWFLFAAVITVQGCGWND